MALVQEPPVAVEILGLARFERYQETLPWPVDQVGRQYCHDWVEHCLRLRYTSDQDLLEASKAAILRWVDIEFWKYQECTQG